MSRHISTARAQAALKTFAVIICMGLVLMMAAPGISARAYADNDTIYETWADYKAAEGTTGVTWNVVANEMDKLIYGAYDAYVKGDTDTAYHYINDCGYYGWYETTGFERTVMGSIGGGRVSEVELAFSTARSAAKKNVSLDEFMAECEHLSKLIHEDANVLDGIAGANTEETTSNTSETTAVATVGGGYGSAIATFIAAFGIILREGVEAILVIGAIIAYLVKSGNKKHLKQVYIGAALGVVCSFIAAGILTATLAAGQAPQELVEGFTALFAVVVLFWVSNWMLSKSESKAWDSYIKRQVESSVSKGSVFALAFTAWLAVFREGAEVILFYQPLINGDYPLAVWAGFGAGLIVIAIIFVLMRYFSVRLPIKPFFLAMSILMSLMCISFLGAGVKELIEGGLISATNLGWFQQSELLNVLGIYPIAETLFPQIILAIIIVITFIVQIKRNREAAAQADEEKAATSAEASSEQPAAPADAAVQADAVTQPSPQWDGVTTWEEYEKAQKEKAAAEQSSNEGTTAR